MKAERGVSPWLATASGKVILLGEHAVVYGRPALAVTAGPGCRVRAELGPRGEPDKLRLLPFDARVSLPAEPDDDSDPNAVPLRALRQCFATLLEDLPGARPSLLCEAELLLPSGAGLGSSAALSVALARAVDGALFGEVRSPEALIEASLRWERVAHGNPSGVDSAIAVYGGIAEFRRGQSLLPLHGVQLPALVVAHSGAAPSTREMVEQVAQRHRADPVATEHMFDAIEALVAAGRKALIERDVRSLGEQLDGNHRWLVELGLSTPRLDALCERARAAGAVGAKLTGGGGGGCMIAVCTELDTARAVRAELSASGADAFILEEPAK